MEPIIKYFKRNKDGQPYEVPEFDSEVEYIETTELLTPIEVEIKYGKAFNQPLTREK